jgi:hypothetical protein
MEHPEGKPETLVDEGPDQLVKGGPIAVLCLRDQISIRLESHALRSSTRELSGKFPTFSLEPWSAVDTYLRQADSIQFINTKEDAMQTSVALRGQGFIETPRLLIALLVVFALGGLGGYVARAVRVPATTTVERLVVRQVTEPCPSGTHVVVWYSAKDWGCVSDAHSG